MTEHMVFFPEPDVPEGFLLEFWLTSYQFAHFRELVEPNENQSLQARQGLDAPQAEHYSMTEEAEDRLPNDFTPTWIRESNSMVSDDIGEVPLLYFPSSYREIYHDLPLLLLSPPHQEVMGALPQLFLSSSHQDELLTSTLSAHSVAKASGQNEESLDHNMSKDENAAMNEDPDPMLENLLNSFWLLEQDQTELFGKSTPGEQQKYEEFVSMWRRRHWYE